MGHRDEASFPTNGIWEVRNEANPPTCGPLLILSPAFKRWELPRRQGLCSQCAHHRATSDFVPRSEALGTPW